MAQSITDEELQLKKRARRRLVGAIALVLVVVIFLPMVLDNEPKPVNQDIAIRIPSRESNDFNSKIVPAQAKPAVSEKSPVEIKHEPNAIPQVIHEVAPLASSHVAPVKKPAESPEKASGKRDADARDVAKADTKAAPKIEDRTEAKAKPEPVHKVDVAQKAEPVHKAESAQKSSQDFVIQLGAFSNMENAKQRQAKLKEMGVRFYTATLKTPSGEKLRVRAGPFATRQDAEKVQAKLKAAGIQDGIVAEKKD